MLQAASSPHEVLACKELYGALGGASSSNAKFDPVAAEQCLADLEAAMASCAPAYDLPACDAVFTGSKQAGAECTFGRECAAGLHCGLGPDGPTCQMRVPAAEGQPCDSGDSATEDFECENDPDFYCDYATDTCRQRALVGADCASAECASDAFCDAASVLCVARLAAGSPCSGDEECVESAYCDGGVCAADKANGEPCSSFEMCADTCDVDTAVCRPFASGCVTS